MTYSKPFRHVAGLALSVTFLGSSTSAFAWGDLGHRVIRQTAFQELNAKARNEITPLPALYGILNSFADA